LLHNLPEKKTAIWRFFSGRSLSVAKSRSSNVTKNVPCLLLARAFFILVGAASRRDKAITKHW